MIDFYASKILNIFPPTQRTNQRNQNNNPTTTLRTAPAKKSNPHIQSEPPVIRTANTLHLHPPSHWIPLSPLHVVLTAQNGILLQQNKIALW